jgi:hypothetical protein
MINNTNTNININSNENNIVNEFLEKQRKLMMIDNLKKTDIFNNNIICNFYDNFNSYSFNGLNNFINGYKNLKILKFDYCFTHYSFQIINSKQLLIYTNGECIITTINNNFSMYNMNKYSENKYIYSEMFILTLHNDKYINATNYILQIYSKT